MQGSHLPSGSIMILKGWVFRCEVAWGTYPCIICSRWRSALHLCGGPIKENNSTDNQDDKIIEIVNMYDKYVSGRMSSNLPSNVSWATLTWPSWKGQSHKHTRGKVRGHQTNQHIQRDWDNRTKNQTHNIWNRQPGKRARQVQGLVQHREAWAKRESREITPREQ